MLRVGSCVQEVSRKMLKAPILPLLGIVVSLLVLSERTAEAYVDPGTASYIFQVIAGGVLGAVFLLRTYWNRVLMTIRSLVTRDAARDQ